MRKFALMLVLVSAFFAGSYYVTKTRGFEQYRIKTLDAKSNLKKHYRININLASSREFENLPGIGPALAQRIVKNRDQFGSFKTVDDISRVKGIGEKKLSKFRRYLWV